MELLVAAVVQIVGLAEKVFLAKVIVVVDLVFIDTVNNIHQVAAVALVLLG